MTGTMEVKRGWTRPLAALIACALLAAGLGLASPAAAPAAKRGAKAGKGKRGNGKARGKASTKVYVAVDDQNPQSGRITVAVQFNARNMPVRVRALGLSDVRADCGSLPNSMTWDDPRPIPVTAKRVRRRTVRKFAQRYVAGEEEVHVSGYFKARNRQMTLVVSRSIPFGWPDHSLPGVQCELDRRFDAVLGGAKSRGGRGAGGRARPGGKAKGPQRGGGRSERR